MIKTFILTLLNLFNFKKPRFSVLRYADVVIEGKAFFLVSWRIENGYRFSIKVLHYRTHKAAGSAYIAVPDDVLQVELVAANFWRMERRDIRLLRETIAAQVDFYPARQFDDLTLENILIPKQKQSFQKLQISPKLALPRLPIFNFSTRNLNRN
jgi:hypothetical protein